MAIQRTPLTEKQEELQNLKDEKQELKKKLVDLHAQAREVLK